MNSLKYILRIVSISILVLFFTTNIAFSQDYYKVKAAKGDGIFSLLRRYKLIDNQCNLAHFLGINNLKRDSKLKIGNLYKMPILIYFYDGKSIRSTIGENNLKKALRIQKYNNDILKKRLRRKNYIESKILWVPYAEIYCKMDEIKTVHVKEKKEKVKEVDRLPKYTKVLNSTKKKTLFVKKRAINKKTIAKNSKLFRYEPLFGKRYSSIQIEDHALENRVFYILSGHGGPDPGAQCTKCNPVLCEDEYAYDVSLRLARDLIQHGAIVHIIVQDKNDGIRDEKYLKCDKDEVNIDGRRIPLSQRKRLKQRSDDINKLYSFYKRKKNIKSQLLIVTHVDSRHKDQRIDVFFSYAKGSKTGKKIAINIKNTFEKKYSKFQKGRGYNGSVGQRNWYVLRNTFPPAVFIELANIKNPKDHKRILIPTNRQAVANWIFEGVRESY